MGTCTTVPATEMTTMTVIARFEIIPVIDGSLSDEITQAIDALDEFDILYGLTVTDTVIGADQSTRCSRPFRWPTKPPRAIVSSPRLRSTTTRATSEAPRIASNRSRACLVASRNATGNW